jgi:hypothetical protein
VLFDASATRPVRAGVDGSSFVLAYLHGNPTPCDGACPGTMTIDPAAEGPFGVMPTYWSDAIATGRLDVRTVLNASLVTSISETQVAWQWRPLRREGWQADGTLALVGNTFENRTVVDVAPLGDHTVPTRTSRIAALHYLSAADALGYHEGLTLTAVDEAGSTTTYEDLFSVGGVRDPRVVEGSTWVAALQTWDFPPTVQLVALGEPERSDIAGSSCGVASFDAVATLEGGIVVVQDCEARSEIGGAVELEGRAGGSGRVTVSQRRSFVPSRAALLPTTGAIAVAVVEQGASAPTLFVVRREGSEWVLRETIALPVAEGLRLPITSVDIAATADRPLIVTWTGTPADPEDLWAWGGPEAAYSVVERCPCIDELCI